MAVWIKTLLVSLFFKTLFMLLKPNIKISFLSQNQSIYYQNENQTMPKRIVHHNFAYCLQIAREK